MTQQTTTTGYNGWTISITRTPYQGGELGDERGYTAGQLSAMRARLDDLSEQAVRDAFPGAEVDWRTGGWDSITASYEGDGTPGERSDTIEVWVRDTMDSVFQAGEWANLPDA